MDKENDTRTNFKNADLVIRQRVDAYNAALQANTGNAQTKDALLSSFEQEVANLSSQLAQVENTFGKGDPMARVMREALESAKCRLETRKIELAMHAKEQEEAQRQDAKMVETAPQFERKQKPENERTHLAEWLLLLLVLGKPMTYNTMPTRHYAAATL